MKKIIIFSLIYLHIISSFAGNNAKFFQSSTFSEITVLDLEWKNSDSLPKDILASKPYQAWLKYVVASSPSKGYAEINIDGNTETQEILIASSLSGSGGRNFLLIQKSKNNNWKELASIFGAPIFMKSDSSIHTDLQTYYRDGLEMWLNSFSYNNGYFKIRSKIQIPRAFVTECFYQKWLQINLIGFSMTDKELKKQWSVKMKSICPDLLDNDQDQ